MQDVWKWMAMGLNIKYLQMSWSKAIASLIKHVITELEGSKWSSQCVKATLIVSEKDYQIYVGCELNLNKHTPTKTSFYRW